MKLEFDSKLEYQKQAITSVVDLFQGQTPKQANFTVSAYTGQVGMQDTENGIGNKLELLDEEILENLNQVQLKNGLPMSENLKVGKYDFDVEMETGTGKTYVYLRTIFELNKNYGFSKFIIVVPSIAIKEGVYKSLQITQEHFKGLYENLVYDYFIYDSSKPEQVRSFAVSQNIQIMIINIDAFRKSFEDTDETGNLSTKDRKTIEKKTNLIHRSNDTLNGIKPINLIRETNPFVIIDEPQSVDTTPKSKKAIQSLNPLCTFRYSATHVDKHNLVYKLDAIDAFDLALVKQIEVGHFESGDNHNSAYMKLISVDNKKSPITARIELDCDVKGAVKRKTVTVRAGDDLSAKKLGNRELYEGYIVNEIWCEKGNEYVDFTSKEDVLTIGMPLGDIDDLQVKQEQISKTIEEHLNKELMLNKLGIKVLSLFFIDRVANFRYVDSDGETQKGIYAKMFEASYKKLIKKPKYNNLFAKLNVETPVDEVYGGYFSGDKKGLKDTNGSTNADDDTYSLIMKDKEKLLSFGSKLRFIFSHSALREGWDNPNVFQICTLNQTHSEVKKRQEIGRGLRICVNQNGQRVHGFAINTLTIIANESYESYAKKLQTEYEKDQNIKFGVIETHTFANISIKQEDGTFHYMGHEMSEKLYHHFEEKGYINSEGKVQDKLRTEIKSCIVDVPQELADSKIQILSVLKKACGNLNVKPLNDKRKVELNKAVFDNEQFKELWSKVKFKTTYEVDFDSDELIRICAHELATNLTIAAPKAIFAKAKTSVTIAGVETEEIERKATDLTQSVADLPDIITFLQNETNLTRKSLVSILTKSGTLPLFKKNPQKYMQETLKIISAKMKLMIVDGIKYTKIGEDQFYAQELFKDNELFGYLSRNMIQSAKSPFEYTIFDSQNEESFAKSFESNEDIKFYAKLPDWFKIQTPLGPYNPDWAVLIEKDGEQKLYFVLETKGNTMFDALRPTESAKIQCGKKHFEALDNEVSFSSQDNFNRFIESV